MKTLKRSMKMFKYNLASITLFEFIYRLMLTSILSPLLYMLLNLAIDLSGVGFLNSMNLKVFLMKPTTYFVLFLAIFIVAFFIIINMSAMIYAMEASIKHEKINAFTLLLKGIKNSFRVFLPKNWGMLIYVLIVVPMTNTVMISGTAASMRLPDAFAIYFTKNKLFIDVFLVVYFLIAIFAMFSFFTANYFTLHKVNYKLSKRMSRNVTKRNLFKVVFGVLLWNLFITALLFFLEGTLATIVAMVLKNVFSYKKLYFMFDIVIQSIFAILYFVFAIFATPLVYSYLCSCYYEILGATAQYDIDEIKGKYLTGGKKVKGKQKNKFELKKNRKIERDKVITTVGLIIVIAINCLLLYIKSINNMTLDIAYSTRADVTAHRGDSKHAPENTMEAIKLAYENQADIIEIDVRQTKDGELVIMHDESMKRTCNVRKKVGNCTLEYIRTLDASSGFKKKYTRTYVPTLEEVLEFAVSNDVTLNIEIKTAKTDKDIVEKTVALIEEYDYVENCVVASDSSKVLKKIKKINPDITTVYIMAFAYGDIGSLEYADIFSVKSTSVTAELVKNIHKNDKEIYVWTLDSENEIKAMLLLDVDNIITNNPYNTKEIIYNANDTMIIDWLNRLVSEY